MKKKLHYELGNLIDRKGLSGLCVGLHSSTVDKNRPELTPVENGRKNMQMLRVGFEPTPFRTRTLI